MVELYNRIIDRLLSEKALSSYKYVKKNTSLNRKFNEGIEMIMLQYWEGFDLERDEMAVVVRPLYLKRFDAVHLWFNQYSYKKVSDLKYNYTIGLQGAQLGVQDEFFFLLNNDEFEQDYMKLKDIVLSQSTFVFNKFQDVVDVYNYKVKPMLQDDYKLLLHGGDWIFESLYMARKVSYSEYGELKEKLKGHFKIMFDKGEPNAIEYYPKFDKIVSEIEKMS